MEQAYIIWIVGNCTSSDCSL